VAAPIAAVAWFRFRTDVGDAGIEVNQMTLDVCITELEAIARFLLDVVADAVRRDRSIEP
jgi:hypothetical protein